MSFRKRRYYGTKRPRGNIRPASNERRKMLYYKDELKKRVTVKLDGKDVRIRFEIEPDGTTIRPRTAEI